MQGYTETWKFRWEGTVPVDYIRDAWYRLYWRSKLKRTEVVISYQVEKLKKYLERAGNICDNTMYNLS